MTRRRLLHFCITLLLIDVALDVLLLAHLAGPVLIGG